MLIYDPKVNEKEIKLNEAKFILDKIGNLVTKINFIEDKGNTMKTEVEILQRPSI